MVCPLKKGKFAKEKQSSNHHFAGDLSVFRGYLEDHPRTRKWLIAMIIVSPLRLSDPFQMAELHGLLMGAKLTTYGMILLVPNSFSK